MSNTGPSECRMVVADADVAGFTKACEGKSDVDTFNMLDKFYEFVGNAVEKADGKVVKFMGDSALMVFPDDKAAQAVSVLQDLKQQVQSIWREFDSTCQVRIKAHVGTVAYGPIGPYKAYDVIGKTLNELFRMPYGDFELSNELADVVVKGNALK